MSMQSALEREIKKVCPINGISFGDLNDRSTWRIDYAKEASHEQKIAAQKVLDNFVWDDNAKEKERKEIRDERYISELLYRKEFVDYRERRPDATFSDFMDYLESIKL